MTILNTNGRLLQVIITIVVLATALIAGYYIQQAQLEASIDQKYYSREVIDAKMTMICYRLDKIEEMMQGVDGKLDRLLEREP